MTRAVRTYAALAAAALLARCAGCDPDDEPSCPEGQVECHGVCVDPASYGSDPANCGGCGTVCPNRATCVAGICECPAGEIPCAGSCVDPLVTDAHCGGCGISCGVGACAGGACECGAFQRCPDQSPRCVDGLQDPENCGPDASACGNACLLANEVCDAGTCACPADTTRCPVESPTACRDLQTDEANCNTCGNACAVGAECTAGECLCPGIEEVCGGACVNRSTDESNCGACGTRCATGATCTGGACTCPAERPLACGGSGGPPGPVRTCCAGDGCCGPGLCQTEHSNGVGQSFFDCAPLGTYDVTQAEKAAQAWQATGTRIPGNALLCVSQSCLGWQAGGACGVWCYGGAGDPLRGRALVVQSLVCQCPRPGSPIWN